MQVTCVIVDNHPRWPLKNTDQQFVHDFSRFPFSKYLKSIAHFMFASHYYYPWRKSIVLWINLGTFEI